MTSVGKKKATKKTGRRAPNRPVTNEKGEKVTPKTGLPASEYFVATDCAICNSEDTFCYNTSNGKHYIKCRHCGFTWSKRKRVFPKPK